VIVTMEDFAVSSVQRSVEQPSEQPRHRSTVGAYPRQWTVLSGNMCPRTWRLQLVMRSSPGDTPIQERALSVSPVVSFA